MMINLDHATRSLGDEAPSGTDLGYEPAFDALARMNQPTEERVIGDSVIEATDPDYDDVVQTAVELLGRSRDLRIAVILANAALRTRGLPAFEVVLRYVRESLETYWDSVHPQLDHEDEDDPTMRVNAVLGLADSETILRALRLAPLTDSKGLGRFCLRDVQSAEGEINVPEGGDAPPERQLIIAAFSDSPKDHLEAVRTAVADSLEHIAAVVQIFDDRIGAFGPDLDPLRRVLLDIQRRLPAQSADKPASGTATELPTGAASTAELPRPVAVSGTLQGPSDVQASIDRILEYYARVEPSSPLPLLLRRARRLVSADFVTIMRDIAPSGMDNVSLIGGFDPDETDTYENDEI
ncbi:MAG: type VI secretion system protein TssA [Pseudomonadota bacterium]